MTDPSELRRRAAELTDRADQEWLAAHPTSIASVTGLLNRSD